MYQFDYHSVSDEDHLNDALKTFYSESNQPRLLEIFTPRTKNDEILINYFGFLS